MILKLNLPLELWLPRKTMDDKRFPLNQNFYRNCHHQTLNKAKVQFKQLVAEELMRSDRNAPFDALPKGQYRFHYTLFPASGRAIDVMNPGAVLDKFAADALVELGVLPDDNHKIIPEFSFSFGGVDKDNPRCELTITRIENGGGK